MTKPNHFPEEEYIDVIRQLAENTVKVDCLTDKVDQGFREMKESLDKGFAEIKDTLDRVHEIDKRVTVIESKPKVSFSIRGLATALLGLLGFVFKRH